MLDVDHARERVAKERVPAVNPGAAGVPRATVAGPWTESTRENRRPEWEDAGFANTIVIKRKCSLPEKSIDQLQSLKIEESLLKCEGLLLTEHCGTARRNDIHKMGVN